MSAAREGLRLVPTDALPARACSDIGNGQRLVDHHGRDLRYIPRTRVWLAWDGRRWAPDDMAEAERRAKSTLTDALTAEAMATADDDLRRRLLKWAAASQSASRVRAAIEMARSELQVVARIEDFDRDPWAFTVRNGTLDLRTGELRPHRREDLITRLAPVDYDPDATAPTWQAVLERSLPCPEVRGFVQRLAGYGLTGDASEHTLAIFHGDGANGKTVVLRTLLDLMGSYGLTAAPELLVAYRRPGSASPEVAELAGRRFVAALETDDGAPLAESRVKALTGGDRAKGRALYSSHVEIEPSWTLVLATNHAPRISGQDEAIWRRIALVPFTVMIPEAERDPRLVQRLASERSGILKWALQGCAQWQAQGLEVPEQVRAATKGYRADSDPLAEWLADCCALDAGAETPTGALWDSFLAHAGGKPPITRHTFGRRLAAMGLEEKRTKLARIRSGIALLYGGRR